MALQYKVSHWLNTFTKWFLQYCLKVSYVFTQEKIHEDDLVPCIAKSSTAIILVLLDQKVHCLICGSILTPHTISVRNDRKCKHMFLKIIQYVKVYPNWCRSPFPSQTGGEFIQTEIKLLKVIHCSLLWNSRWLSPGWLTGHVINTPHRLKDHLLGFCLAESRFWKSLWKEVIAYQL